LGFAAFLAAAGFLVDLAFFVGLRLALSCSALGAWDAVVDCFVGHSAPLFAVVDKLLLRPCRRGESRRVLEDGRTQRNYRPLERGIGHLGKRNK